MTATTLPDVTFLLAEIPSETSAKERRLLFNLFSSRWSGAGPVVEVGPFLGGTTRAIALGMAHHPQLQATACLHTFDRFGDYYSPQALRAFIDPMVTRGSMSLATAEALCATGNFLNLFNAVHEPHDYYRLLRVHASALPDLPEEIDPSEALGVLAGENELGGVFIDGCKSWAATHYAMRFLLPSTQVGAPVIFQDFGWYTCFWISSFVHAMGPVLELQEFADSTYVFRLKEKVTADLVARRFAKSPAEMGGKFFWNACTALLQQSVKNRDARGALIAQLHLVAALATLDRKKEAAAVLGKIDARLYGPLARMIDGSRKSPTYLPGGQQIVWTEA